MHLELMEINGRGATPTIHSHVGLKYAITIAKVDIMTPASLYMLILLFIYFLIERLLSELCYFCL